MYKQSPGRNNRSKGIKVKNVLQICLLLAVCFWLIYQIKHSHDKKKEFDEDDAKSSIKTESRNELMKLGRKDLLPRIEGLDTVSEKHREEPEDETVEEEEGNKPEEEDLEEKNDEHREDGEDEVDDNDQEKNDEHREDGEDEVDDHDQEKNDEHREDGEDEVDDHEKSDVERDQEEDAVDEDKEREEDNEKETEERDSEVNDSQVEEENSLKDHDHDEDSSSSHEAREEHYKADDASSAVTHDTAVNTIENESGKLEQEAENAAEAKSEVGVNNIMQINASQKTTVALKVEDGKADGEDSPPNTTNSEEKHDDPISSTAADTSVSNSTRTEGLTDNSESTTHSTELSTQTHDLLLQNGTQAVNQELSTQTHDLLLQNGTQAVNQEHNATVGDTTSGASNMSISTSQQNGNSADTVDDNQIDSNLTFSSKNDKLNSTPDDSSNVSGDTELSLAENVAQGNATVEAVDNMELPLKDNNATVVEKADTSGEEIGTNDEDVDASIAENSGEVQDDLIDTSDSSTHLEEKHIRTDVETLPEIQTEGNMEDAAAE